MKRLFLISVLVCGVNAHPHHEKSKVDRSEKTYSVELADRVVTVHSLKGPPPRKVAVRKSSTQEMVSAPGLIAKTFFVQSTACEDGRTYLEWWSLMNPSKGVHRAWSNLDWSRFDPLNSFQQGQRKYAVMHFSTVSSKKNLSELGKPQDPSDVNLLERSKMRKELFSMAGSHGTDPQSLSFMNACHTRLLQAGVKTSQKKSNQKSKEGSKTEQKEKKRSTLRYWRSR